MREQFSGFFTPSEEEFTKLWNECIFAFDANVLLGLYRSTADTQRVFFSVLDKIADRIFLPHQAASEYLKNRLNVISFRSDQYGKIKNESDKLSKLVESIVQEHAIRQGKEISDAAKEFVTEISGLVDGAAGAEPDLLRSDDILARLADLFGSRTGQPYTQERQKEVFAQGAVRYAQAIPPGYKDDKKGEPGKYGDLLIWFQLMDHARAKQKPVVFVTGDVKEDWLQQHKGETLGPRPELRQEMMAACGARFWMYTTPRFLEFAKQFLDLKFDTRKAESEFEKIEKQDKDVTQLEALPDLDYYDYVSAMTTSPKSGWGWNTGDFFTQPISYAGWTAPVNAGPKQEFLQLLPLNGVVFNPPTGRWTCKIVAAPDDKSSDSALYHLEFQPQDHSMPSRGLKLRVSLAALGTDADWKYKKAISNIILKWLVTNQASGETTLLP